MKISYYNTLYEDDHIVIVNKTSGISVTADRWDVDAPRLDTLLAKEFGKLFIVHRIDKDTSGIVVFARTAEAHRTMNELFEHRQVSKIYHALVHGRPLWTEIDVTDKLRVDSDQNHRTVVNNYRGREALTHFRLLGSCGPHYSWIEAQPHTGRTHQIRVHLCAQNLPIVCDNLYGTMQPVYLSKIKKSWHGDSYEERPLLSRLALHAYRIAFPHPATGVMVTITAPYHKDLDSCRRQLAKLYKTDPISNEDAKL